MNILTLSLQSLRYRSFHTFLCVLMTGFAVMAGVLVILTADHIKNRIARDTAGVDLVVGARGSPLQLILSSLYHVDIPVGNITAVQADVIAQNRDIKQAIPLALGDNIGGVRIVGTSPDYIALYSAVFDAGQVWSKPFDAVAGAYAAQRLHLAIGAQFSGAHGLAAEGHHHDEKYTIVGVLKPTGTIIDRLVLTSVESVQHIHGQHHDHDEDEYEHEEEHEHTAPAEVTALLVKVKSPRAVINLPRTINRDTPVMAASPAMELTRLSAAMGMSGRLVAGASAVLLLMAALSIFSGLASSLETRGNDLAVMRLLGMSRKRLFGMIVIEALLTAFLGALAGLVTGHLLFAGLVSVVEPLHASGASALTFRCGELILCATVMVAGLLAALIPALRAYRTDVSGLLRGSS